MSRIIIVGGHGKVALRLARILADRGDEVTSLIRNPDHAAEVAEHGATPVVADVEHLSAEELSPHFAGHDAVVWSAGAGGGDPERTYAVDRDAAIRSMEAAASVGVKRYVMVSYLGARADHGVDPDNSFFAYAEAKAAADDHLRQTDLDWTILGPGGLTLDPGTGLITVGYEHQGGKVSRDDVAAVAAAALRGDGTIGRTIPFVGGETSIGEALAQLP
ncbi:SDR family oxidoreductase [Homoserinimonas sp. A520]